MLEDKYNKLVRDLIDIEKSNLRSKTTDINRRKELHDFIERFARDEIKNKDYD